MMDNKKGRAFHFLLSAHLAAAGILIAGAAQATDVGAQFVHYATAENIVFDRTAFSHPLTDGNPHAIVHVTQNWNPPGSSGTYNVSPIGVWYVDSEWTIASQYWSEIPVGAAFNVWVPPVDASTFVHTANVVNTNNNWTYIDYPLTNNNPDALLRVTHNWNPGGGNGLTHDRVVGVFYSSNASKWAIFNQDLSAMPIGVSFNVTVLPNEPTVSVHTATPANTIGNWTSIDHPLTNNNPDAIVSITQNWNPGGILLGTYNDHPIGVWYHNGISRWAIFNQDIAAMPEGASFNVSAPSLESAEFVHLADTVNTTAWATYVDHPLSNDNPHALLFVTQNWNPGGAGGVFNDHSIGVWYSDGLSRWTVVNQDSADIPVGASFNVSIPAVDASTFVHTASDGNTTGNSTIIDNPETNGNPDAIVHVTQNRNPSGVGGVINDHSIGVWYSVGAGKWAIFNQDIAAMPEGASFNVSIPAVDASTIVHTASVGSISGNSTVFHHPHSDGNPDAIVWVTQNWNPGGSGGVYNNHEIGVWYTGNDWSVFNQDDTPMPVGASFNITVVDPPFFSDGFESGDTSGWSVTTP